MGLITGLITLPLTPVRCVAWLTEKVAEHAELELYDEGRIMRELAELETAHACGEISEDDFDGAIEELLTRLERGGQLQLGRGGAYG
jgi:hypothetical protein